MGQREGCHESPSQRFTRFNVGRRAGLFYQEELRHQRLPRRAQALLRSSDFVNGLAHGDPMNLNTRFLRRVNVRQGEVLFFEGVHSRGWRKTGRFLRIN